jgi:hypothetical protein
MDQLEYRAVKIYRESDMEQHTQRLKVRLGLVKLHGKAVGWK